MERTSPGTPLGQHPFRKADVTNSVLQATEFYQNTFLGNPKNGIALAGPIVKVHNTTGDDLDQGYVLQLGALSIDSVLQRKPWFEGDYPADPVYLRYAVLLKALADDAIGWAAVSGCCVASLTVTNTDHTHAIPVNGDGELVTDFIGPIEILSPLDATGAHKLAFVNLKCDVPELLVKGAAIAKGASGTLRIYSGPLSSPVDSGNDVDDVFSIFTAYGGDLWAQVNLLNGQKSIHAIECT